MGSYRKCVMTGFICRLCSEHKNVVIHIYSKRAKEMSLLDKITMLPITIKKFDKLPKTICENCIEHLCQQFELIQTIKKNVELRLQHNLIHTNGRCPTECPFCTNEFDDPIAGTSSAVSSSSSSPSQSTSRNSIIQIVSVNELDTESEQVQSEEPGGQSVEEVQSLGELFLADASSGAEVNAEEEDTDTQDDCPFYGSSSENLDTGHLSDSSLSVNRRRRSHNGRFSW